MVVKYDLVACRCAVIRVCTLHVRKSKQLPWLIRLYSYDYERRQCYGCVWPNEADRDFQENIRGFFKEYFPNDIDFAETLASLSFMRNHAAFRYWMMFPQLYWNSDDDTQSGHVMSILQTIPIFTTIMTIVVKNWLRKVFGSALTVSTWIIRRAWYRASVQNLVLGTSHLLKNTCHVSFISDFFFYSPFWL